MVRDTQDRLAGQLNWPKQILGESPSHRGLGVQISGVGNRQWTITWEAVVRRSITPKVHGRNFTHSLPNALHPIDLRTLG